MGFCMQAPMCRWHQTEKQREKETGRVCQRGYKKFWLEQEGCTGYSGLDEVHIWEPSDPCSHGKTGFKPMMMMTMLQFVGIPQVNLNALWTNYLPVLLFQSDVA